MSKQDEIKAYFEKWTKPLGLLWWTVDILFYDNPSEILRQFTVNAEETTLARTYADWRYGTAKICINLPAFENLDAKEIERTVIHELVHILVNEMREGEIHHEERVVTGLTKAFEWTLKAGKDELA
jgi:hypothetical protein